MTKVFLGGTCAESTWREELIPLLQVNYYNPVVADWTPECQEVEIYQKDEVCGVHFYAISKEMTGVFSIAEVIESSMTKSKIVILQVLPDGFSMVQLKSLKAVCSMVQRHGGIAYIDDDLHRAARILNNCFKE